MSDTRRIRDVLMDKIGYTPVGTLGKGFAVGLEFVIAALGLDPDTVLERRCERCDGVGHLGPATRSPQRDYGRACPDCDGSGWIEVNRIVVVPVCTGAHDCSASDHIHGCYADDPCPHEPDMRALRIGRAVLASEAIADEDDDWGVMVDGTAVYLATTLRETYIAAGDDDE